MNDFTKEELTYLYDSVDNNIEYYSEPDIAYSIRDKLKSMINSYCAHKNRKQCNISEQSMCVNCGEELHE